MTRNRTDTSRTTAETEASIYTAKSAAKFALAVAGENYLYSRARSWRADGYVQGDQDYIVTAYGRKDGIKQSLASVHGLKEAAAILDMLGKPFPLSPTEAA